jgi:primosomal protein N' (replication factor Y)
LIGRWGRKWQSTKIILQSYVWKNKLLQNIHSSNYKDFFLSELEERKSFSYPPFVELAYLYYKHTDQQKSLQFMTHMYEKLSQSTNGTIECMLAPKTIKRNNQYFSKIILKWKELRKFLAPFRSEILKNKDLSLSFEY